MNNRIYKFRAWVDGKMVRQSCVDTTPPIEYPLMQFTGLLDKNGKEIYEGDILGYWDKKGWPISWSVEKNRFVFTYTGEFEGQIAFYVRPSEVKKKGIIGNIFEQPNLLKP